MTNQQPNKLTGLPPPRSSMYPCSGSCGTAYQDAPPRPRPMPLTQDAALIVPSYLERELRLLGYEVTHIKVECD